MLGGSGFEEAMGEALGVELTDGSIQRGTVGKVDPRAGADGHVCRGGAAAVAG